MILVNQYKSRFSSKSGNHAAKPLLVKEKVLISFNNLVTHIPYC